MLEQHLDFVSDRDAMRAQLAKFSSRDAAAFDGFMAAMKPIYEQGILGAGRRPFERARDLAAFTPSMLRLGAALPLYRAVARALRASARARGVLFSFAVHRRRPVSRTSHIWRARLPAVPRRGVVRPRRGLRDRRGDGARAGRPLRRAGGAHRASAGRGDGRRARGRRAARRRCRRLERRRPAHARARRPQGAAAQAHADDVLLPAVPRLRPDVRRAAAPHAARRRRVPQVHPRRHARGSHRVDVLDLRPRARA